MGGVMDTKKRWVCLNLPNDGVLILYGGSIIAFEPWGQHSNHGVRFVFSMFDGYSVCMTIDH